MSAAILCPVCRQPLNWGSGRVTCDQGHHFDRARSGYVNLWQGQRQHAGDDKEMLRARAAFLDAGHFKPLAATVTALLQAHTPAGAPLSLLDAGCGPGYYLAQLAAAWPAAKLDLIGMDLAKEAARLAARRLPAGRFFVGDVWQPLLFAEAALDVILNVFAPRNAAEFARVLRPEGLLLVVMPGPDHLAGLRRRYQLLAIEADKEAHVRRQLTPAFSLVERRTMKHTTRLIAPELKALLTMLPGEVTRDTAPQVPADTIVQLEFVLLAWRRQPEAAAKNGTNGSKKE